MDTGATMQVESNSKWVKDGEIITVFGTGPVTKDCKHLDCVMFQHSTKTDHMHILTERDFLDQYKPYEPVYEYRWAYDTGVAICISQDYFTEREFNSRVAYDLHQRLDFTKRERKCKL